MGGIETVKVNIMLRIYANKWHVYAGLAILNPSARVQIDQYATSCTEIFKLMLEGKKDALRERVYAAREAVFFPSDDQTKSPQTRLKAKKTKSPILLSESVLDQFNLGKPQQSTAAQTGANSHLSILAMVDCWAALDIHPFAHLDLAATPIFRMWIGVAENLYRTPAKLDGAIDAALHDTSHRSDDLEFVVAARGWSQCVSFGNFALYEERFKKTAKFFEGRFAEAAKVGSKMIKSILEDAAEREREEEAKDIRQ